MSLVEEYGIPADAVPSRQIVRQHLSRARFARALKVISGCGTTVTAVAMAMGRQPRRNRRRQRQVDTGCPLNIGDHVCFGDYLQSLVDKQDLLRREY
jgi:hypothetical protein